MDLHDLARKIYEELGYSRPAEDALQQLVERSTDLWSEAAAFGVRQALRRALHRARARLKQLAHDPAQPYLFADWPMMGQGRLGAATRQQVRADAQRYQELAQGNLTCYCFLRVLAEALPEEGCVRDYFTEAQLVSIWQQACVFSEQDANVCKGKQHAQGSAQNQ